MDRSIPKIILACSFAVVVPAVCSHAGVLPIGQPEYEFIYDQAERIHTLNPQRHDYQLLPYSLEYLTDHFRPFESFFAPNQNQLSVMPLVSESFTAAKDREGEGFELLRGSVNAQPRENLQVYFSFVLDEQLALDPDYTGKKWRGLAGRAEQAMVNFTTGKLNLTAGRFASGWGVRRSLIFSNDQFLDGLAYSYRFGRLTLSYRLAQLDGHSPEADGVPEFENRFIAAHRLDVHLSDRLRVGAFETVLFGGPGRQIDLWYLNPFIFFHGTQLNEDLNDNTNVGIDFDYVPTDGLRLYGQILVDDFQIEKNSQGDQEPDQLALLGGIYWADLLQKTDIRLEYTRVNNWTFNQTLPRNRYLNNNDPIGQVRGNDYDQIEVHAFYWWQPGFNTSLTLSHSRQGEGSISAAWTSPWLEIEGDYSEPFPTGVVEKVMSMALGAKGFIHNYGFVDLQAGVNSYTNRDHITGDDTSEPFVVLRLTAFLPHTFNID